MSSNDTESVSDCTTESHCADFLNVCALESDSSSGSRISSTDDQVDAKTQTSKKYIPVKASSISPPQFQSKDRRRRSSCAGLESQNIKTMFDAGRKRTSISGVNFNFALDEIFPNNTKSLIFNGRKKYPSTDCDDDADNDDNYRENKGKRDKISLHSTSSTSRKNSVNGGVTHRGRRYKLASKEKVSDLSIKVDGATSVDAVNTLQLFLPKPPTEKKLSPDNFLMQSFVNRMQDGEMNLPHKQPPAIDVIAPSPTLSTLSNNLGKSTPPNHTQIAEDSQSLRPSMLTIKSTSSNDWLSSGSSSGTISPISCTLRCPSTGSNSSGECRSPLPPLKNTPVLRRRNLLPPICCQETLSPSSCSSHGSASRTPSPGSGKLQSPTSKEYFSEISANNSPTPRQRSHNLSPLLQYVISQQSMQHSPEQILPQYNTTGVVTTPPPLLSRSSSSERQMKTGGKKYRKREYGNDSSDSSQCSAEGQQLESPTSASSLEVAPRSPDNEVQRPACFNTMFLPDIKHKSIVKSKVFDGLANDFSHMNTAAQNQSGTPAKSGSSDVRPNRRSSRKFSVANTTSNSQSKRHKEVRNRISNDELNTSRKGAFKFCAPSKSLDYVNNSPVDSPIVRRKLTRNEDNSLSLYIDKRQSQQEATQNDLRQLLQIKTCNRD